ncbi:MAG: HupE/UreJ family protein [Gammaproteobacteria bacterium]|nr:HupE/UreJ family protein [Gammaproteobacteria bacterium]
MRWFAGALCGLPLPAFAHSPIEGLDDFYIGLLHPLFVPAHLLGVLTLGVLVAQQGVQRVQSAVVAYFIMLVAGLATTLAELAPDVEVPLLAATALIGVLVAAAIELPRALLLVVGAVQGVLLGLDSAQPQLAGSGRLAALLGTAIAASLLMLYALAFAEWFSKRAWQRIGLRVAGSWAAASALLVLALAMAR